MDQYFNDGKETCLPVFSLGWCGDKSGKMISSEASDEQQMMAHTLGILPKNIHGASYKWHYKCTFCGDPSGTKSEL